MTIYIVLSKLIRFLTLSL